MISQRTTIKIVCLLPVDTCHTCGRAGLPLCCVWCWPPLELVWLMLSLVLCLPSMLACFFVAVPGDTLARDVFSIFQMTCDLNCTAEGICWDPIICLRLWDLKEKHPLLKPCLFPVTIFHCALFSWHLRGHPFQLQTCWLLRHLKVILSFSFHWRFWFFMCVVLLFGKI